MISPETQIVREPKESYIAHQTFGYYWYYNFVKTNLYRGPFWVVNFVYKLLSWFLQNVLIEKTIAHPGYSPQNLYDDIALIKLAEPADFTLG